MTRLRGGGRSLLLLVPYLMLLGAVLALPDPGPPTDGGQPVAVGRGRVVALTAGPDASGDPGSDFTRDVRVEMLEGESAGRTVEAYVGGATTEQDPNGYRVGDEVLVTFTAQPDGTRFVAVSDRWRLPQLAWLTLAFAAAVVVIGGSRGVRALLALVLTIAVVIKVLVPLVLQGAPPIPLAVVTSIAIAVVTIGLTEGVSRASVAAILGTASGLALTALLSAVTTIAAGFTNAAASELVYLQTTAGSGLDLRGLLLAAFILGALGVLDDVTVTQAATVEELARHSPLRGRALFLSALNVGRSHIAATVNTLFLAYLGAGLPLLVLFALARQPIAQTLNSEVVAVEIVRTLVGSLGIVATVPLTTAIAAALVGGSRPLDARAPGPAQTGRPGPVAVGGLVCLAILVVVALAASAGVGARPRPPLPVSAGGDPVTGLTSSPPGVSGASDGVAVESAGDDEAEPAVGRAVELVAEGKPLGSVTVERFEHAPRDRPGPAAAGRVYLDVHVHYTAAAEFDSGPADWIVLAGDGSEYRPAPGRDARTPRLGAGRLAPGKVKRGWLTFVVPRTADQLWLDFRNADGSVVFSLELLGPR